MSVSATLGGGSVSRIELRSLGVAMENRLQTIRTPEPKGLRTPKMVLYSAFVRPRLIAKVAGYNGRFMSIMISRRNRERPARVTRLP